MLGRAELAIDCSSEILCDSWTDALESSCVSELKPSFNSSWQLMVNALLLVTLLSLQCGLGF